MNKLDKGNKNTISEAEFKLNDEMRLMDFQQAATVFKNMKPEKIGPEEILLLLLGIVPDKPIKGKTMLIKQIFLAEREIFEDVQDLKYVAHKFGPHSFLMDNIVRNMEYIDLIKKSENYYSITDKGLIRFQRIAQQISKLELESLKRYRIAWDELGIEGILNLVYNRYPAFTDKSIIKYRYQVIKWNENDED